MRKLLSSIERILIILLLLFIIVISYPYWSILFYPNFTQFTSENWHASHKYKRLDMARDYLNNKSLQVSNHQQVIKQFGKPDIIGKNRVSYFLSLTAADYMLLSFIFDKNKYVIKVFIYQS